MQWVLELKGSQQGSRSFIYFDAEARGDAARQADHWMRANSIDPNTAVRLGWAFDQFLGKWELTHNQELTAEFYTGRSFFGSRNVA